MQDQEAIKGLEAENARLREELAKAAELRDMLAALHQRCHSSGSYERLIDSSGLNHMGRKTSEHVAFLLASNKAGAPYSDFIANYLVYETAPADAQWLAQLQHAEAERDAGYFGRTLAAAALVRACVALGMKGGLTEDSSQTREWHKVLAVDLPTGQVMWHIHEGQVTLLEGLSYYPETWDGHTPDQRDQRLKAFRPEVKHDDV